MAWRPRKPRSIARSSGVLDPAVAGRPQAGDPRQPDLFARFIPPMLATLADRLPAGERWSYEVKHDGYRVQAHVGAGTVRLYTRGGYDWTERMPAIAAAMLALPCRSAVIDGEAIQAGPDGISDFFALHAALADKWAPTALLIAFDILELDATDLRGLPLSERRTALSALLAGSPPGIEPSERLIGDDAELLRAACRMGLEGIVAKRVDQPYRSGRSDHWRKVKCTIEEPFAVIAWQPEGARGVASLSIARLDADRLVLCGSVGSGIGRQASTELRTALEAGVPVVVDVEHRGSTPAGELRHPVFKGWHAG